MQQKSVTIDGVEYRQAILKGKPVAWVSLLAALHCDGNLVDFDKNTKRLSNAYLRNKHDIKPGDATRLSKAECEEIGVPCPSNAGRLVFTEQGYRVLAKVLDEPDTSEKIIEQYFGHTDKPSKKEIVENSDDAVLDIAVKIIAERQAFNKIKTEINVLQQRMQQQDEILQAIAALIYGWKG